MKEYGIVDSGDSLRLGVGAMTDARMKSFFAKMVRGGAVPSPISITRAPIRCNSSTKASGSICGRANDAGLFGSSRGLAMLQMIAPRALVSLHGVGKIYANGAVALQGVDLEVRSGEFLTLLGPSGCGKTTILRLIAGLDKVTSGALIRRFDAAVGFVFQEPTLMPWASVFDNVFLPLRLQGRTRQSAAPEVMAALALVGLADFGNAYPRELSGGMKMRASIARALVLRPALLLMDEPFAALDEITRFRLNDDLLRLQGELGATIVFVTHSVYESAYLSTRIVVMAARPGRIVAEIDQDAPMPRDQNFRSSPAYMAGCRLASEALQSAMQRGNPA